MNKLDDIYIKIETLDTCFHALENFISDATRDKTQEAINKLDYFFYLTWEQLTEIKKEFSEVYSNKAHETSAAIKKLEAENEALKKKLNEIPYA